MGFVSWAIDVIADKLYSKMERKSPLPAQDKSITPGPPVGWGVRGGGYFTFFSPPLPYL